MGTCVLAIDGWESAAGQATLATNCVLPNGTAFLHKFEAVHASQTAEFLSGYIESMVEELRPLGCLVVGLIGDNAANLQKSFEGVTNVL